MNNQKGVLIKDAHGNVIGKRVYSGDVSNLDNQLKAEGVIYAIYSDTDPTFSSAQLPPSPPSVEIRVLALEQAVSDIAAKTGTLISLKSSGENING